jgi:hypothetical protein
MPESPNDDSSASPGPDARLRQTASKEKAGELTKPLLAAHSVCGSRPYKGEGMDHFLARITHLHLQERGLMKLGALGSGCCPMASHVYTYDNKLETLEGLSACGYLTHLYVQNNLLRSVEEICTLKRLQKLYVSNNHLSSLEAIGALGSSLVELHCSSQRPAGGEAFDLAPEHIARLDGLEVLSLADNALADASPLAALRSLAKLDLSRNCLPSPSTVAPVLQSNAALTSLDLTGNPVANSRHALDALMVQAPPGLRELNGRELLVGEQTYLRHLHRLGRR